MKRITYLLLLALLVMGCSSEPKVKYVFYFIGDGMGVNEVIGTNLYNQANGQENVNFTSFPVVNFITTVSANSLVTDSSAAGTALATEPHGMGPCGRFRHGRRHQRGREPRHAGELRGALREPQRL